MAQRNTTDSSGGNADPQPVPADDDGLAPGEPGSPEDGGGSAESAGTPLAPDATLAAAPLEPPPARRHHRAPPPGGMPPSAVPQQPPPGRPVTVVDHDGRELGPDDLFDDPGPHTTFLVARTRVYRQYLHENSASSAVTQLLYPQGARVPRDQAEALRHSLRGPVTAAGPG